MCVVHVHPDLIFTIDVFADTLAHVHLSFYTIVVNVVICMHILRGNVSLSASKHVHEIPVLFWQRTNLRRACSSVLHGAHAFMHVFLLYVYTFLCVYVFVSASQRVCRAC